MITQTEATIFLSDQRGCSQTDWFRSFHCFNFGAYQAKHRAPFGCLRVFNDDTLAGEKSLKMQLDENTDVILLPLVGAVEYQNGLDKTGFFGRTRNGIRTDQSVLRRIGQFFTNLGKK
jgi:quercetin 2,3-dioxygenase